MRQITKVCLVLIFLSACFSSLSLGAAELDKIKWTAMANINALAAAFSIWDAEVEARILNRTTVVVRGNYWQANSFVARGVGVAVHQYFAPSAGGTGDLLGFITENKFKIGDWRAVYFGPTLGEQSLTAAESGQAFGVGGEAGTVFYWNNGIALDTAFGLGYYFGNDLRYGTSSNASVPLARLHFTVRLGLGYAL